MDDKYYVGKTTQDPNLRFGQHLSENNFCSFTDKYTPIEIAETYETFDPLDEDKITKKYMIEYGIENVRGGSYNKLELEEWQIKSLNHEFTSAQFTNSYEKNIELESYLDSFNTIGELASEIKTIKKVYQTVLILKNLIEKTCMFKIEDLAKLKEGLKQQEKIKSLEEYGRKIEQEAVGLVRKSHEINTLRTKKYNIDMQIRELRQLASSNIHNLIQQINCIYQSMYSEINDDIGQDIPDTDDDEFAGDKPENKIDLDIIKRHQYYDIKLLAIVNYNLSKRKQLKDIYDKYKSESDIKEKLSELYKKRIDLMKKII